MPMIRLPGALVFWLCLLTLSPLYGQRPGFSWDFGTEHGRIFKHTPKIIFSIPGYTFGAGVNFQRQTYGKQEWEQHQGYPLMGVGLQYFNFGDPAVLGHALSIYPNLTIKLIDRPKWMIHFRVGSGLAWLNRHYDRLTNPTNNSIGSQLNNTTCFRLVAGVSLSPHWTAFAGGSFTHFSNGASQMPNLGINVPAISASLRYTPEPISKAGFLYWEETRKPPHRLGLQTYFAMAYKETSYPGAAKWPVYSGSAAGLYRISKVQNLLVGVEYEYHQSVFLFSRHTFAANTLQEARQDATRWMVFLATEWRFGNTGLLVQAGAYVSKNSALLPYPLYNKLGLRYYLPPVGRPATQFFVSIYLKSHIITADYISIGIGARIQ
ncbi:MAG: acyloxyacyl hydrolase [Saprospirales bacterium]|nr:acyloxyacyl hydrolase [Saprospirales bacterium]MBK8490116.1 acyloxyacyl hydrolase [Saprospirales bacterium]